MKEFNCVLESIPPSKIINKSKVNNLDNFFLALGVIFNDLKGLILFNDLLKEDYTKPVQREISSHAGEYTGIQLQIFKLSVALINEFFSTIKNNKNVVGDIRFKLIEKGLNKEIRKKWDNFLYIIFNPDKNSDNYISKIARIRSNIVYHYDQSGTQLRDSFVKKFFEAPKDDSNRKAYYSIGDTIGLTRFFYCDAMVQGYLNEHLKIDTIGSFEKTNNLMKDMNMVIVNLMKNYYLYKKKNK